MIRERKEPLSSMRGGPTHVPPSVSASLVVSPLFHTSFSALNHSPSPLPTAKRAYTGGLWLCPPSRSVHYLFRDSIDRSSRRFGVDKPLGWVIGHSCRHRILLTVFDRQWSDVGRWRAHNSRSGRLTAPSLHPGKLAGPSVERRSHWHRQSAGLRICRVSQCEVPVDPSAEASPLRIHTQNE